MGSGLSRRPHAQVAPPAHCHQSPRMDRVRTCHGDRRPDPLLDLLVAGVSARPPRPPAPRPLPGPPPKCHLQRPTTPTPCILKAQSFCLISLHMVSESRTGVAPTAGIDAYLLSERTEAWCPCLCPPCRQPGSDRRLSLDGSSGVSLCSCLLGLNLNLLKRRSGHEGEGPRPYLWYLCP